MGKGINNKHNKKEKTPKNVVSSSSSSSAGLLKLSAVIGLFSVVLFFVLSLYSGDTQSTVSSFSRAIPKYANPDGTPLEADEGCADRNEHCKVFAARGECENNIGWMVINCPISCNACHLRDSSIRCNRDTLNISNTKALVPNSLDNIFQRIEYDLSSVYKINVLSRSPHVVTIDNFMTNDEADALIAEGGVKWERSTDTGTSNKFGETGRVLTERRTSSNAWCRDSCLANPYVKNIVSKIKYITQVDDGNYESFQVLRYENGQYYKAHHDTGLSQFDLSCGQRILTFFLYLSDVEEGGETAFPLLNISVTPKKGKALLWSNVHNDDPMKIDDRTLHEARPVVKGMKYAANTWIHQYDYKISNKWGCTGTFE